MHLPDLYAERQTRLACRNLTAGEDLARLKLADAAQHGVVARQH
jgi:hypothetical protein